MFSHKSVRVRKPTRRRDESGLALVATLLVLTMVGLLSAASIGGAIAHLRTTSAEYAASRAFYAAEAGAEAALGQLKLALQDGHLSDEELADIDPPTLEGFSFTEFSVTKDDTSKVETLTDGPFAGLYALTQDVVIQSAATAESQVTDRSGAHSTVVVGASTQAIPIFQFATFFEGDYEEYAGSEKHMTGRVHANGAFFVNGNGPLYFHETLTTPGDFHRDDKTDGPDSPTNGIYIEDAAGNDVNLTFDSDDTPDPDQFKAKSNNDFDGRLRTSAFGVDSLKLPMPDGVSPRELVRPKEDSDGEVERSTKFAWQADMYVTVDMSNIQTRDNVCGVAGYPVFSESGEIDISPSSAVAPGETVTFTVTHPDLDCSDFDDRAHLVVEAGSLNLDQGMDDCTFTITIPNDAEELEIEIELDGGDYLELSGDVKGKKKWKFDVTNNTDDEKWPTITIERPYGGASPSIAQKCDIFEFTWEAFYDWYERRWVDVMDFDVDDLGDWIDDDPSNNATSIVYVEFVEPTGTMPYASETNPHTEDGDDGTYPAFRTKDANELEAPLTAGSEYPIYQWGDFNTINKQPAALFGDRLAVLSNNWTDPDQDDDSPPVEPAATHTYANYSIVTGSGAGIIGCYYAEPGCVQPEHGPGGWIRLIEDWKACGGKCDNGITGSIVFLWAPVHATPYGDYPEPEWWKYYNAPKRIYTFDEDLLDPAKLPPATPNVGSVLRASFREGY